VAVPTPPPLPPAAAEAQQAAEEEPLNVGQYRRLTQRRLMLAHIRETVEILPELAEVDWAALDTSALHAAVAGIIRMHTVLTREGGGSSHRGGGGGVSQSPRGLSPHELAALVPSRCDERTLKGLAVAQSACVICHEDFKVGNELCRLPGCAHCYHAECIGRWLAIKASCPLCNADLKAQWTAADMPSETY
tara:strand:- start:543 stop:1115 length:573 start_codon:yes stop_codon:yes gene_type:complete